MGDVKVMMLISTVVGGLLLYVIFERFLKKALLRAQGQHKTVEVGTLIIASTAIILAVGSLIYTLNTIDALQDRITALEKAVQSPPRASP
jgi:uncharacterized protein YacL